ncbi:DUF3455 domain-containing protein [Candidatus Accumulibacter phosphatis]|uniref:DUF3455 domain-containing protein n=1 Tax=Candidatus Accumulibacter phosphatis TaxID=327160 RepID=A0A5S4F160_9PROT|nr:DUF3455 domain-containing protein [Candidatus Accumulibacter phosphatis]TMQ74413.1 hypothetical protein ACCUM_1314 [Candidatus Accumulibacter phosphatis]
MKAAFTFLLAGLCLAAGPAAAKADIPAELAPDPGEKLVLTLSATGVQIYECRATAETGRAAWAFVGPEARLFDPSGREAGHHGAGPFWQADDGSRVEGKVRAKADAPAAGAIPWLLLTARGDGSAGRLGRVASIQRVNTTGGTAPESGCDGSRSGQIGRVPYTADYLFYARP